MRLKDALGSSGTGVLSTLWTVSDGHIILSRELRAFACAGASGGSDRYDRAMIGACPSELFLIDGNSLAYRAFFALPESIATSDGQPTNAIFGFASMLVKILTEYGAEGRRSWSGTPACRAARRSTSPTRRSAGRARTCCGAVAAPRAAGRGVRLPQRQGRGLRGRRRDRDARRARPASRAST